MDWMDWMDFETTNHFFMRVSVGERIIHEDVPGVQAPAWGRPWSVPVETAKVFSSYQDMADWLAEARQTYPSCEPVRMRREQPNGDYDEMEIHAITTLELGILRGLELALVYHIIGITVATRTGNIHAVLDEAGNPILTTGGSVVRLEPQL